MHLVAKNDYAIVKIVDDTDRVAFIALKGLLKVYPFSNNYYDRFNFNFSRDFQDKPNFKRTSQVDDLIRTIHMNSEEKK